MLDERFDVEPIRHVASLRPNVQFVFLGPVDEYFDYRFGSPSYRSLEF